MTRNPIHGKNMDILYPYKHSEKGNSSLRYSLRSLVNLPHDRVVIIGDKPKWAVNIKHIKCDDPYDSATKNVWRKIYIACEMLSENFILMDDDHIIWNYVSEIPYYHGKPFNKMKMNNDKRGRDFYYALHNSKNMLRNPKNFNRVHTPIVYNRERFKDVAKKFEWNTLHKTIYCNYYQVESTYRRDAKARTLKGFLDRVGDDFISLSPQIELHPKVIKILEENFNKCKYEADFL